MMRLLAILAILAVAACGTPPAVTAQQGPVDQLAAADRVRADIEAIERRTGGRLGLVLLDDERRTLIAHRSGERFAMCSTFKLALASRLLDGVEESRWRLETSMPVNRAGLLPNSPVTARHIESGRITMEEAAAAIVTVSDNTAANLLLERIGGPAAFTAWLRANDDEETRLDRWELELNENRPGDPRDTTTPRAAAAMTARIFGPDIHLPESRERLLRWTAESRTGARRIRAGLPAGWEAGDKTGTCGNAWNDIAWFRAPDGRFHVLAVYLDRPSVSGPEAEAAIADVARLAVTLVR